MRVFSDSDGLEAHPNRPLLLSLPQNPMQTYVLTILTHQRRFIFARTANAELIQETLFRHRSLNRYQLHAFAIMPDHIHVLITPSPEHSLPRCIQFLKGSFSRAVREQYKGEVWIQATTNIESETQKISSTKKST